VRHPFSTSHAQKRAIRVVRVKADSHAILTSALDTAVERGIRRHDKYSEVPLSPSSAELLRREVPESFWLAMEDLEAEVK